MAQRTAYSRIHYSGNALVAHLTAGINAGATSFAIDDATGWPDGGTGHFYVVIDPGTSTEEKVDCTSRSSLTVTVGARGQDSTSASSHSSGAVVHLCFTATEADEANYWVAELAGAANAAGDLPYADNDNSLTRLGIGTAGQVLKTNAGATAPEWGQVAAAGIASDAVTTAKILDANVTAAKIASAVAGNGLAGGAGTALSVNVDDSTIEINSDTVRVKDAGITAAKIAAAVAGNGLAGGAGTALSVNVDGSTLEINTDTLRVKDAGLTFAKIATASRYMLTGFSVPGNLATGAQPTRIRFPFAITIAGVSAACGTAPTGASLIVDLNKNGTTVFSTQANRPTITATNNATASETVPDTTALAAGDYLTIDIDQVGSSVVGADLTLFVKYVLA